METIETTKLAGLLNTPALSGTVGLGGSRLRFDVPSFDGAEADACRWAAPSERPIQAPVAAVAVHEGCAYAAAGAGSTEQFQQHHQDQTIAAKAAATAAAEATPMWAFRGPEPWGKRT